MSRFPDNTDRRVVFQFLVPVHVEMVGSSVVDVVILDNTPISAPTLIDGDADYLEEAVNWANDGQAWPSWQFGY